MKKLSFESLFTNLILLIGTVVMVFPFYWMFLSAFKTPAEVNTTPPTWFPSILSFDNFVYAFKAAPFARYFVNSILVTTITVVITMLVTILAAFAFSRLKFPGRDILFSFCISLMLIPFEMIIITNYSTIAQLKLTDNLIALIIPFTSSIFNTYILRNFFLSIPDSLYYSAKVDGASNWQYLWKIMVPIARPSIVTIALLYAILSWNAFLWPLLVINSRLNRTLPLGLYAFITDGGVRYERLMAAATMVVIPIIILFLFARKSIVKGVARGGLKG
jgi:multiple sugar transport system permease protein